MGTIAKLEAVDISVTDHTCTITDCTHICATDGTVIKVDFTNASGVTVTQIFPLGTERIVNIPNITKVYKVGTDATANIAVFLDTEASK